MTRGSEFVFTSACFLSARVAEMNPSAEPELQGRIELQKKVACLGESAMTVVRVWGELDTII